MSAQDNAGLLHLQVCTATQARTGAHGNAGARNNTGPHSNAHAVVCWVDGMTPVPFLNQTCCGGWIVVQRADPCSLRLQSAQCWTVGICLLLPKNPKPLAAEVPMRTCRYIHHGSGRSTGSISSIGRGWCEEWLKPRQHDPRERCLRRRG